MLTLNPHDNQGVRYVLAGWLVAMNQDDALEELLAQYADEWSASWASTSTLHTFRRIGPGKAADTALIEALQVNPHVPLYLLGVDPLPKDLPDYYSPGDENEAVTYLAEGAEGWVKTPGAVEWLGQSLSLKGNVGLYRSRLILCGDPAAACQAGTGHLGFSL
jgi:hypothetical protein